MSREYVTPLELRPLDEAQCAELAANEIIVVGGENKSLGYVPRDLNVYPLGATPFMSPWTLPTIPRSEWRDRIEAMDRSRSRISDHRKFWNLKSSNQDGVPYCWIHGETNAMRLIQGMQGTQPLDLSATGAGCLIKNYRKVGGNTPEGIAHLAQHGVGTLDLWPENRLDRRYDTPEYRAAARKNRVLEWWEMQPNNFDQMATALLHRLPVVMGLLWWGHMIVGMDLVALPNGQFGVRIWNSWGDEWGENGEQVLTEKKATAFDQLTPRVVTANNRMLVNHRGEELWLAA